MRFLLALFFISGLYGNAIASPMTIIHHAYEPLVYSKKGYVKGCGIRYDIMAKSVEGDQYFLSGSINDNQEVEKYYFFSSVKLVAASLTKDFSQKAIVPIISYWVRVGDINTRDYKRSKSDNKNAYFAGTFYRNPKGKELLNEFFLKDFRWFGFSLDGVSDFTVELPKPTKELALKYIDCLQAMTKDSTKILKEMQNSTSK